MAWLPAPMEDAMHVALPPEIGAPAHPGMKLPSAKKTTVPVGTAGPPATVAVSVIGCPGGAGFTVDVSDVVVADRAPKAAATEVGPPMVSVHDAVPEHAPLQPRNTMPAPGAAVSVTAVLGRKSALQVVPQLMPAGTLLTVPAPVVATVSGIVPWTNDAFTLAALFIGTTHAPMPPHAPDHPPNTKPAAGVAVRVTAVPDANEALQVVPQSMPAGALATVPEP